MSTPPSTYLAARLAECAVSGELDELPPFPKNAMVELSNWCNHACVFCTNPRMERGKGFLSEDVYQRFVREAVELGVEELGLYSTGEPFFTKNLAEHVRYAKGLGVRYVYLTSNAALATPDRATAVLEAGLDSIKFSVNAGSREKYRLVHGHDDFDKVIANIRFISELKKQRFPKLKVFASCVVTSPVDDELDEIRALLEPLVDEIQFSPIHNQSGQTHEQFALLKSERSKDPPPQGQASPCFMLWKRVHLTYEGFLSLCCVDYEGSLRYADLNQTSLREAWVNETMREMRRRQILQELHGTLCQNCLYGTQEKVRPISPVGREQDAQALLESSDEKGTASVNERIGKLLQLTPKRARPGSPPSR